MNYVEVFEGFSHFLETTYADLDFQDEETRVLVKNKKGQILLLNWHGVAREIWFSSPITGAHHFYLDQGKWKNTRTQELFDVQIKKEVNLFNE